MSDSFFRACVIGYPVAHSLSPAIHNHWIEKYSLAGRYDAREVAPDRLAEGFANLLADGYRGFSVTIPHKQAIKAFCSEIDDTARHIGAVNTLAVAPDGAVRGMNTDWFGFIESIRQEAPDFDFTRGPALVLGAGGAGRAVVYGLMRAGCPGIMVANRTLERAQGLGRDFGVLALPWNERENAAKDAALVVNTTALGMTGQDALDFDVSVLKPGALVCDIVYSPLVTPFLRDAAAAGLRAVGGLGMLLHQARPAFDAWFGVLPDVTGALRGMLEARLS